MRPFNEAQFNTDWEYFWGKLTSLSLDKFFNEELLKGQMRNAPGALGEDTGIAYPGALLNHIVLSTSLAEKKAKMVSATFNTIDMNSVYKVCLLMHLSKIEMYVPNDNLWEIEKRGLNYKFATLDGRLKFGERSILNIMNAGITLTPQEFEAIRCIDKKGEDNKNAEYFDDILSLIVRQANEMAYALGKERAKKL